MHIVTYTHTCRYTHTLELEHLKTAFSDKRKAMKIWRLSNYTYILISLLHMFEIKRFLLNV